jgi:hypothetical protein
MVDLIAAGWVDYRSAQRVERASEEGRFLCVTGQNPLTARMYVIRAAELQPNDSWKIASFDGVFGEELAEQVRSIRMLLRDLLKVEDDELDDELQFLREIPEPVFVSLPFGGVDATTLQELRSAFPGVTFFFLSGDEGLDADQLQQAQVELLVPALDLDTEAHFCKQYERALRYLVRR